MSSSSTATCINMRRFCTECVPDFAPLGGSRPDGAVVGCAAMSVYEGALSRGVIMPPDVLDTALAALCAPLVVSSVSDLRGREVHFHAQSPIPLRMRSECVAMALVSMIPPCDAQRYEYFGFDEIIDSLFALIPSLCGRFFTHASGLRGVSGRCRCVPVPLRLRTIDDDALKQLSPMIADLCGLSVSLQLDESVTTLPGKLFSEWDNVSSIDLRQTSIQKIGDEFLRKVFPHYVTMHPKLTPVELPACLTEVEDYFLKGNQSLTSVELPVGLTKVGRGFLLECRQLARLDLRNHTLQRIDDVFAAFCLNLAELYLPDTVTEVGDDFLCNSHKIERIDLRHTALEKIGARFALGSHLLALYLPDTVTEVGDSFLGHCKKIEQIDLRNTALQSIDRLFASECSSIVSVYLPDSVTEVGDSVLEKCMKLEQIDLRNTALQRVGEMFACQCPNLKNVYLPDSVVQVGEAFLQKCDRVEVVSNSLAVGYYLSRIEGVPDYATLIAIRDAE